MKLLIAISIVLLVTVSCSNMPIEAPSETIEALPETIETPVKVERNSPTRPSSSTNLSCADQGKAFLEPSADITTRWLDARARAEYSPSGSLDEAIGQLQALRSEWQQLDVPVCSTYARLGDAKTAMNRHMSGVIKGYSLRKANESDSAVNDAFDEASEWLDTYVSILKEVLN